MPGLRRLREGLRRPAARAWPRRATSSSWCHVLSFLDENLGNDSSNAGCQRRLLRGGRRAGSSSSTTTVFAEPARQEGTGYTDAQLKTFAEPAGVTGAGLSTWQQCYDAGKHNQYVESVQTQSAKDGVSTAPRPSSSTARSCDAAGPDPRVLRRPGQGRHQVTAVTAHPEPAPSPPGTSAPLPSGRTRCASWPASSLAVWITERRLRRARRRRRGRPSTSPLGGAVRHRRRPALPRHHHARSRTSARAATRSRRSTIWEGGLGIWGAVALGALGAWIGCRRSGRAASCDFADARRPGSPSPRPSAAGATGSTTSSTAARPTCPGA